MSYQEYRQEMAKTKSLSGFQRFMAVALITAAFVESNKEKWDERHQKS